MNKLNHFVHLISIFLVSILNFLERFCAFDYKDRNQEIYGQDTPPDYDLAKVTAPVALYWGDNDWLAQQTVSKSIINNWGINLYL